MPNMLGALALELGRDFPTDTGYDKDRHGSKTPPIPLDVSVDELMRRIVDWARTWAEIVADRAGLAVLGAPPRSPSVPPVSLSASLRESVFVLSSHIPVLISLDPVEVLHDGVWVKRDGGDAAVELLDLHHAARKRTGWVRRVTRFHSDECASCRVVGAVTHRDGDGHVRCASCGGVWSWDQWAELRKEAS